jgi:hypothetical protein
MCQTPRRCKNPPPCVKKLTSHSCRKKTPTSQNPFAMCAPGPQDQTKRQRDTHVCNGGPEPETRLTSLRAKIHFLRATRKLNGSTVGNRGFDCLVLTMPSFCVDSCNHGCLAPGPQDQTKRKRDTRVCNNGPEPETRLPSTKTHFCTSKSEKLFLFAKVVLYTIRDGSDFPGIERASSFGASVRGARGTARKGTTLTKEERVLRLACAMPPPRHATSPTPPPDLLPTIAPLPEWPLPGL